MQTFSQKHKRRQIKMSTKKAIKHFRWNLLYGFLL